MPRWSFVSLPLCLLVFIVGVYFQFPVFLDLDLFVGWFGYSFCIAEAAFLSQKVAPKLSIFEQIDCWKFSSVRSAGQRTDDYVTWKLSSCKSPPSCLNFELMLEVLAIALWIFGSVMAVVKFCNFSCFWTVLLPALSLHYTYTAEMPCLPCLHSAYPQICCIATPEAMPSLWCLWNEKQSKKLFGKGKKPIGKKCPCFICALLNYCVCLGFYSKSA